MLLRDDMLWLDNVRALLQSYEEAARFGYSSTFYHATKKADAAAFVGMEVRTNTDQNFLHFAVMRSGLQGSAVVPPSIILVKKLMHILAWKRGSTQIKQRSLFKVVNWIVRAHQRTRTLKIKEILAPASSTDNIRLLLPWLSLILIGDSR